MKYFFVHYHSQVPSAAIDANAYIKRFELTAYQFLQSSHLPHSRIDIIHSTVVHLRDDVLVATNLKTTSAEIQKLIELVVSCEDLAEKIIADAAVAQVQKRAIDKTAVDKIEDIRSSLHTGLFFKFDTHLKKEIEKLNSALEHVNGLKIGNSINAKSASFYGEEFKPIVKAVKEHWKEIETLLKDLKKEFEKLLSSASIQFS